MSLFPKITSPCPYKNNLKEILEEDYCTRCERNVHDLSYMNDKQRRKFMQNCEGEVCVMYSVSVQQLLKGALLATAASTLAVSAADAQDILDEVYGYDKCEQIVIVGGAVNSKDETDDLEALSEHLADEIQAIKKSGSDQYYELLDFAESGLQDADIDE